MTASQADAQFDDVEPPEETRQLDFMIGDWDIEGAFRQPDLVDSEPRFLWYSLEDGRLLRFDGETWNSFPRGADPVADEAATEIAASGGERSWFAWRARRQTRWTSGGFVLFVDDGRQGGQHFLFYSPSRGKWLMQSIHAPTEARAGPPHEGALVAGVLRFSGVSLDRRGEHLVETVIERHSADHYSVRQDVSFDAGETWIRDQLVYEIRRSAAPPVE